MTQQQALDILKLGHNVYLTGPAGSGKTYLLNQYIAYLRQQSIAVGITASTGIAATHMGGTTIHSFTGMGIREHMDEKEIKELLKKHYLRRRLLQTKVLIIDEISMLHSHLLDQVDRICRVFKNNHLPFGGMQVIMCGDFFQLPPVQKRQEGQQPMAQLSFSDTASKNTANFVTESLIWQEMRLRICYLDEQHRQDDRTFLRILNDIRNSEVTEMTVEYLSERLNKDTAGYSKPTRLFTHNADVDAINNKHLAALPGDEHEYLMSFRGNHLVAETLKKSCLAPEKLVLKVGAQVMFVKNNYEEGYVNGTLGEVIGFGDTNNPIVRTFDGNEITVMPESWEVLEQDVSGDAKQGQQIAAISQLPLRLAWAITVHKSQGMSLDAAEIDLSRSFLPGMGYVALSRVRSLAGLKLMGMNQMALQVNPEVAELDKEFIAQSHEAVQYLKELGNEKKQNLQKTFLEYLKK